jgi:hypothetical protein
VTQHDFCKRVFALTVFRFDFDPLIATAGAREFNRTDCCGRCRRAYVGMSAKGNGGTYHYYACSGRQKLGRKGCDGE